MPGGTHSSSITLPPSPRPRRVVHRPQTSRRAEALPRHLDLVARAQYVLRRLPRLAAHVAQAHRSAEVVAVGAGGDVAGDVAVAPDRLVVMEQRLRVVPLELAEAARQAFVALLEHRVPAEAGATAGARSGRASGRARGCQ